MSGIAENNAEKYHAELYKRFGLTMVRGKGTSLYDEDGKEYLDALAGIAVCGLGHCHPAVTEAVTEQFSKLVHVSNLFYNHPQSELAGLLVEKSGFDRVFFCNSGAEAVEGAVKAARRHRLKANASGDIISMENCFHGRTLGAIAMGKKKYRKGFDPIPEGFRRVPFNDIDVLESAVTDKTTAIVIEPVQGEGGVYPADENFLRRARELCDESGAILIFDEIQCGMGRSGSLFAFEHYGVIPDIVTMAKVLGNGFPIGAVLMRGAVASALSYGEHGTTFGGNPPACAAGLATLRTIIEENLLDHIKKRSAHFFDTLYKIKEKNNSVKDVRGLGLMIGVEIEGKSTDVVKVMREKHRVIAGVAGESVVRFLPPYIITDEEIDIVAGSLEKAIEEVCQ